MVFESVMAVATWVYAVVFFACVVGSTGSSLGWFLNMSQTILLWFTPESWAVRSVVVRISSCVVWKFLLNLILVLKFCVFRFHS